MRRIAIIAAMPGELKPLVEGWKQEPQGGVSLWRKRVGEAEWIAACAGAGQDRAARAFAAVEKCGRIDVVLSIGWAGALSEESRPGEAYRVSGVIDVRTGERFLSADVPDAERQVEGGGFPPLRQIKGARMGHGSSEPDGVPISDELREAPDAETEDRSARLDDAKMLRAPSSRLVFGAKVGGHEILPALGNNSQIWLATAPRVADETEKKRLGESYGAALVDMEAAAIARLARMRGIPFYCIKGVSDGYKDHLPDFNRFIGKDGRFQLARFVAFTLLRPASWPVLIRMGENSKEAALRIAETVREVLGSEVP